ncbi:MAG: aminotransferase class V-fold PLP-dependent enzyme [Henriciella sp.]|nr:aminotransferase class V-fold PLP-dependent enzyme [Henriciella sp.]
MPSNAPLTTRRSALKTLGLGMVAAGAAGCTTSTVAAEASAPNSGSDAKLAHPTHMVSPDVIYMNAANLAPAFISAFEVQHAAALAVQRDPSFQNRDRFKTYADHVRTRLAAYVGADPYEIAITRNTSESNNLIVQGLALKAGDEVVLSTHNHQSNLNAWQARAARDGLVLKISETPVDARSKAEVFESIAAEVTPKTRVIAVSHLTNTTGLYYPIEMLAELAEANNIWLHVDGAQTFGWKQLNLHELGCHSFTGSTHKWFMGPMESGLLYVRADQMDRVDPAIVSVNYWSSAPRGEPLVDSRKFEQLGQRDDSRLAGIEATLDAHAAIGFGEVETRTIANATLLRQKLGTIPWIRVLGADDPEMSGPILRAPFETKSVFETYDRLWATRKIAVTPGSAGMRFSPHIYNTADEIVEVTDLLASL